MADRHFKVGDHVEVVDYGKLYTTYAGMAKKMGATTWEYEGICTNGDRGTIVAIRPHERAEENAMLALVDIAGHEIIIGFDGIGPVPYRSPGEEPAARGTL